MIQKMRPLKKPDDSCDRHEPRDEPSEVTVRRERDEWPQ
jgi:hypothetical protein